MPLNLPFPSGSRNIIISEKENGLSAGAKSLIEICLPKPSGESGRIMKLTSYPEFIEENMRRHGPEHKEG
jgi:hypothetical protein